MNVEKISALSVGVSGQDLHICPPDGGKMESFHPSLHAAKRYSVQEQPKVVYPWSPALLLSNNGQFRAKIDTNY